MERRFNVKKELYGKAMENSFFEYRNVDDSGSDKEFIDNSIEDSFSLKKKNHTVFVAESEESTDGDFNDSDIKEKSRNISKSVVRQSSVCNEHDVSSSNDGSLRKQSGSSRQLVLSSSDEDDKEEYSPEIVPRRRLNSKKKSPGFNESIIGRKPKKRIMLIDSDTENSIVIEHDKNRKIKCMKDTPNKILSSKTVFNDSDSKNDKSSKANDIKTTNDNSDDDSDVYSGDNSDDSRDLTRKVDEIKSTDDNSDDNSDANKDLSGKVDETKTIDDNSDDDRDITTKVDEMKATDDNSIDKTGSTLEYDVDASISKRRSNAHECLKIRNKESGSRNNSADESNDSDEVINGSSEDDGPDEDQMVMSRATRMSIMGVIPKDNHSDSDDSDFIQSDESSRRSSSAGITSLPEVSILKSLNETHLSPLHDITNDPQDRRKSLHNISNERQIGRKSITKKDEELDQDQCIVIGDSENISPTVFKRPMANKLWNCDDDVTVIETEPEVIAVSSDDDELDAEKSPKTRKSLDSKKRSPNAQQSRVLKKSPQNVDVKKKTLKPKLEPTIEPVQPSIKQYMTPASYPNHEIRYVKKHVRETELMKLTALQEELKTTNYILEEMDITSLPDGGSKLIERLTHLEMQVQLQGTKVANMIVEPENPTAADIARDGFSKEDGLSWDDIQKASNAVQPRMFGKQAMSTHMAERGLILDRLRDLYESLASRPADSQKAKPPRGVATSLLPHQLHALAWLRWRETQKPRAGILADDMGLGKTITMLALIVTDKEGDINDEEDDDDDDQEYRGKSKTITRGGTLVVCPASLMQQWGGEVTKHCKPYTLSVCLHHGPARATQPNRLATHDLVCTTYNILQRDKEKNGVLMRIAWRRVILDEAHIVRNYKSATCAAVCALRATRRWCLTGTPVQNKDLDLFALIKFLKCSPFDDLTMWKKWIDNKSLGGQERMSTMMQCLLLRRTKVQLQQKGQLDCLPERATHQRQVTLSKAEMNVYQKVLVFSKTLFAQFLHQRAEKNADIHGFTSSINKNGEYDKMHKKMIALQGAKPVKSHEILVLLLRLRQVCCHCGLIAAMLDEDSVGDEQEDPAGQDLLAELNKLSLEESRSKRKSNVDKADSDEENNAPAQEGTTVTEAIRSVLSPNNPVFDLGRLSSKISAVMNCLNKDVFAHKGDKAVVVSQWTSVLSLVEAELKKARVRCVTLSGSVPVPARPPLINAINDPNSDIKVMLLSLCAGGVGLNLCGANHLLLLDPHWNPQLEEQAQDRIYRVGQKKNVNIYRFMCVDTVEQSIRKLQEAKLEMAENVLTGAKNTNKSKLTIEDLKVLFNMGQ